MTPIDALVAIVAQAGPGPFADLVGDGGEHLGEGVVLVAEVQVEGAVGGVGAGGDGTDAGGLVAAFGEDLGRRPQHALTGLDGLLLALVEPAVGRRRSRGVVMDLRSRPGRGDHRRPPRRHRSDPVDATRPPLGYNRTPRCRRADPPAPRPTADDAASLLGPGHGGTGSDRRRDRERTGRARRPRTRRRRHRVRHPALAVDHRTQRPAAGRGPGRARGRRRPARRPDRPRAGGPGHGPAALARAGALTVERRRAPPLPTPTPGCERGRRGHRRGRTAPVRPRRRRRCPVVLGGLLADDAATVVEVAAWATGEWVGRMVEEGLALPEPDLVAALPTITAGHDDALCREAAVAALGAIGDATALPAILAATTDKATVRRRAVIALAPFEGEEVDRGARTGPHRPRLAGPPGRRGPPARRRRRPRRGRGRGGRGRQAATGTGTDHVGALTGLDGEVRSVPDRRSACRGRTPRPRGRRGSGWRRP